MFEDTLDAFEKNGVDIDDLEHLSIALVAVSSFLLASNLSDDDDRRERFFIYFDMHLRFATAQMIDFLAKK